MAEGTLAQKLIQEHLVTGNMAPGREVGIRIDQTLTQDATGTLVMLELEAMGIDLVKTHVSAQYVDHNLVQQDFKNPDDHLFLRSAARRFGLWFSRPGTGVSHPVHMARHGKPGATLLGSDSHSCAAGSLGMLAIGAGGLEVALAMAGEPFFFNMPEIWGIRLEGKLPDWVSAKDVILEMLRRHGVAGGIGRIVEYHGPGVASLSAMDRHVIANMGAELGATTTVFPSDKDTWRFLRLQRREHDWTSRQADAGARYDVDDTILLDALEPLIAKPSSPGNVVPVREVEGESLYQAYIGSSANPGFRDFAIAAHIVKGRRVAGDVSLDINPSSREILGVDIGYPGRAKEAGGHAVVAGENYGQGSSREHAALAPRFLGLRAAMAKSFSRIYRQNLVNFGVLPLRFEDADDYDVFDRGAVIAFTGLRKALLNESRVIGELHRSGKRVAFTHALSERQVQVLLAGGLINWKRDRCRNTASTWT